METTTDPTANDTAGCVPADPASAPSPWYGGESVASTELDRIAARAEVWLEHLLAATLKTEDPRKRSLTLTAVDRLLASREGYLQRLREVRSEAIAERLANGETVGDIADELGITSSRVRQIRDHNRTYISDEAREAKDRRAAARIARAQDSRRQRLAREAAEHAEREAERAEMGEPWLARLEAEPGLTVTALAAEAGTTRQQMAVWLQAARDERADRAERDAAKRAAWEAKQPDPIPWVRAQDSDFEDVESAFEAMAVGTRWRRRHDDRDNKEWFGTVVAAKGDHTRRILWDTTPEGHYPTRIMRQRDWNTWEIQGGVLREYKEKFILELLPASADTAAA